MIPLINKYKTIIVANGEFPKNTIPLSILKKAERIISCDGATQTLISKNIVPDYIIGDLDSITKKISKKYADKIHHNPEQETNDLTKSVNFCVEQGWTEISILAATGKREDHTLGNISLLANYKRIADVQMFSDYGSFIPLHTGSTMESFKGQQVSLFSLTPETEYNSQNLLYPLKSLKLKSWWMGTLNESISDNFSISFEKGELIVFREYKLPY